MSSSRVDLDAKKQQYLFLLLAVFFVGLSLAGIYMIFSLTSPTIPIAQDPDTSEFVADTTPTEIAVVPTLDYSRKTSPAISQKPSSTPKPTLAPKASPTPTPTIQVFTSEDDKFEVVYSSSRTLYPDTETSGNRYTFYRQDSSFAVHVGSDWSWLHPDRQFTTTQQITSQPTFRYEASGQTIIDVKNNGVLYTLQCIHHNNADTKVECEDFISSFKLL